MTSLKPSPSKEPAPRLLPRLVAAAFAITIVALGLASWDIARGRAPETGSPMIVALLQEPDNRLCSRDVARTIAPFLRPGMARDQALAVLAAATVTPPRPWFWRPRIEDAVTAGEGAIGFVRTIRYTAFGNQTLRGEVSLAEGRVAVVTARLVCALG